MLPKTAIFEANFLIKTYQKVDQIKDKTTRLQCLHRLATRRQAFQKTLTKDDYYDFAKRISPIHQLYGTLYVV